MPEQTYPQNIIIHIGKGKTGSSAIQGFLFDNEQLLKNDGVLVFGSNIEETGFTVTDFNNKVKLIETLMYIKKECEQKKCTTIIWSNEAFEHCESDYIQNIYNFFSHASFKIIVYLRRQDKWIQSAYYQWGIEDKIYQGKVKNFDEFYNDTIQFSKNFSLCFKEQLDYFSLLERWADIIGTENIIVQPYEKKQLPEGLIQNFLNFPCYQSHWNTLLNKGLRIRPSIMMCMNFSKFIIHNLLISRILAN